MKINKNNENAKKWSKTNEAVWDARRTAMNPEKKFRTAEIELYRWVLSIGPYGYEKNAKKVNVFLDFGPPYWRHVVDDHIFDVLSARMALKN